MGVENREQSLIRPDLAPGLHWNRILHNRVGFGSPAARLDELPPRVFGFGMGRPCFPDREAQFGDLVTLSLKEETWRCLPISVFDLRLLLGTRLEPVYQESRQVLHTMVFLFPVLLTAILALIWLVVSRALTPVKEMTTLAETINVNRLSTRLETA